MEIIIYIGIGAFFSTVIHYFTKKRNDKTADAVFKKKIDFISEEYYEKIDKRNILVEYQSEILFWISDGIHNIGSEHFQKNFNYDKKEFKRNIGKFFSLTRGFIENLRNERYTDEELTEILRFIKEDFGNYCHYSTKKLDLDRYINLIEKY